jgi:hypothetical protein
MCEGWSEIEFEVPNYQNLTIHFSFEKYQPRQISSEMPYYRMVPPGTHRFYFEHNNQRILSDSYQKNIADNNQMNVFES